MRRLLALLAALWLAAPALAQGQASPALERRIAELPRVMAGEIAYDAYFAPAFRASVPEADFRRINAQLVAANGPITKVEEVTPSGPHAATVQLGFQRAIADVHMVVDPAAPHLVTGLRIAAARSRDDSLQKIAGDLAALPGRKALLVREIGRDAPPLLTIDDDRAGAIGSGFKLWVLAEAARAVNAGEHRWSDVIALSPDILSSPITGGWPAATPMTLQAAATAMIARSDNRATDTVMAALDRARIDATAARLGADPAGLPVLTTHEAFALKADARLGERWRADRDPALRRALLAESAAQIAKPVDPASFSGAPRAIDSIEWFASPAGSIRAIDWLRTEGGPQVRAILAVNPGVDPALAARFAWAGYKGGSEPGVMAMTIAVETRAGRAFAVSGWWNDPAAPVSELTFATIVSRALALVPQD